MTQCPKLSNCGFFVKHQHSRNLACKGFILMYCQGEQQTKCKRAEYLRTHNKPPPDDMMPNGGRIAA